MKVPKKARRALRRLGKMPPAKNLKGHVFNIARATSRYYRDDVFTMPRRGYGGRW